MWNICQALFSLKKNNNRMSSTAVVTGILGIKKKDIFLANHNIYR